MKSEQSQVLGGTAPPTSQVPAKRPKLSSKDIGNTALPTDNEFDIPLLRLDLQADRVDLPFCQWGRARRKNRMLGTWAFYVQDDRFSRLWQRPTDLVNSGCVSTVEPNYSVTADTPRAVALWATYRKRWLARTWQDLGGIRILVDLNVDARHAETNLLGVPRGWRAYATRGSVYRLDDTLNEYEMACERAETRQITFVVYGGGKAVQAKCMEMGWIWFPEEADVAKAKRGRR
jgi:hypothetical protein